VTRELDSLESHPVATLLSIAERLRRKRGRKVHRFSAIFVRFPGCHGPQGAEQYERSDGDRSIP
jgi:hypothetical protein